MIEIESTIVIEYREKEIVKFREEADSWSEVAALCAKPGGTLSLVVAPIEWI